MTAGVGLALLAFGWLTAQAPVDSSPPFQARGELASPRVTRLHADARNRRAIDAFWREVRTSGAPLVEPSPRGTSYSLLTFVWRGTSKTRNVAIVDGVAAGVGGADPAKSLMTRLAGTDVWYRTYEVRNDARFTYTLSENDSMRPFTESNRGVTPVVDPFNPRVFRTRQSYVEMPEAPPFTPDRTGATLAGTVEVARFASPATGNEHTGSVYLPPGFRRDGPSYPLVVVLDGAQYTTVIPGPAIVDTLITADQMPPAVVLFVDTGFARAALLSCSRSFSDVLATEIVPRMRTAYHAGATARETGIGGSSLGGLASACAAVAHPEVFGNVLSQSGSFWWGPAAEPEWLTRRVRQAAALPLRLFLEVGAMEIPEQLETNRRLRDALLATGAKVDYREFNGNHSYLPWRSGFADGLVSLFGDAPR